MAGLDTPFLSFFSIIASSTIRIYGGLADDVLLVFDFDLVFDRVRIAMVMITETTTEFEETN